MLYLNGKFLPGVLLKDSAFYTRFFINRAGNEREVTMFSASSSPPSSVHYELPVPIEESSMGEPTIEDQPVDDQPPPLTFEVVEGASKRGQQKLFNNRDYSYCVKRRRNAITYWHCSFRGKSNHCPASVIQRPEGFTVGVEHNHTGEVGLPETAKLTAAIKRKATDDLFRPRPDPNI